MKKIMVAFIFLLTLFGCHKQTISKADTINKYLELFKQIDKVTINLSRESDQTTKEQVIIDKENQYFYYNEKGKEYWNCVLDDKYYEITKNEEDTLPFKGYEKPIKCFSYDIDIKCKQLSFFHIFFNYYNASNIKVSKKNNEYKLILNYNDSYEGKMTYIFDDSSFISAEHCVKKEDGSSYVENIEFTYMESIVKNNISEGYVLISDNERYYPLYEDEAFSIELGMALASFHFYDNGIISGFVCQKKLFGTIRNGDLISKGNILLVKDEGKYYYFDKGSTKTKYKELTEERYLALYNEYYKEAYPYMNYLNNREMVSITYNSNLLNEKMIYVLNKESSFSYQIYFSDNKLSNVNYTKLGTNIEMINYNYDYTQTLIIPDIIDCELIEGEI